MVLTSTGRTRWVTGAIALGVAVGWVPWSVAQPLANPASASPTVDVDEENNPTALAAKVSRLAGQVQALETEEQQIDPRRQDLAVRARKQVRRLYHWVQGEALAMQGGPEALLEHMAKVQYVRRALRAVLAENDRAAQRATVVRAHLARGQERLARARQRLSDLERRRREIAELSEVDAARDDLGSRSSATEETVTVYGGTPTAVANAPSFGDALGRLSLPVAGRAEVRRVWHTGAEGPGLEVIAPLGTPVRVVYPGRVAFADQYGVYGRIVIVDHGDHYYTVSANLGAMDVRVGQEVSTGTVLGTVGDDGHGPKLYVEVRHGSETIDPAQWFGL